MTYSSAPIINGNIETPDLFGFTDYCLDEDIQAEIFDQLFDSVRSDNLSDDCHPNDLRDAVRCRLNYPIREPYEQRYFHWVRSNNNIH